MESAQEETTYTEVVHQVNPERQINVQPTEEVRPRRRRTTKYTKDVIVPKSVRSEGFKIFLFALSILFVHMAAFSVPSSLLKVPFFSVFGFKFGVTFSLLELVPIFIVFWISRCIYDERYVIKPESVVLQNGLTSLGGRTVEIYYGNVRGIEIEQTTMEKILNVGSLRIGSMFAEASDITMTGIRNPAQYKAIIERRMHAMKEQDGRPTEVAANL